MTALKPVAYRGLVRFRVPSHWVEASDPEGGAEYFEDHPDAPTLRLHAMTFRGPLHERSAIESFEKRGIPRADIEDLGDGRALITRAVQTVEEDTPLIILRWEFAQGVEPDHLRLVIFSLTIFERERADPKIRELISLLDTEIRAAVFAWELGF